MRKLMVTAAILAVSAACAMAQPNGEEIYMEKCKKCHGEAGEGNPKALEKLCKGLDIEKLKLDPMAKKSDEEVRKIIADGIDDTKMPGYADKLTPEEIDAVTAFCRKLVPKAE